MRLFLLYSYIHYHGIYKVHTIEVENVFHHQFDNLSLTQQNFGSYTTLMVSMNKTRLCQPLHELIMIYIHIITLFRSNMLDELKNIHSHEMDMDKWCLFLRFINLFFIFLHLYWLIHIIFVWWTNWYDVFDWCFVGLYDWCYRPGKYVYSQAITSQICVNSPRIRVANLASREYVE